MYARRLPVIGLALGALLLACGSSGAPVTPTAPEPGETLLDEGPAAATGAPSAATGAPSAATGAPPPASNKGLVNGMYAPSFDLPVISGRGTWKLADYVRKDGGGKADGVLVGVMASWCGYCARSLPTLKALETANHGRLAVVILSVDDDDASRAAEAAKIKAAGLDAPVLAADLATRRAWMGDSKSIPRFFFLNKVGEVLVQDHGFGATVEPLMPKQVVMLLANPTYIAR